jgi:hypothetical protein
VRRAVVQRGKELVTPTEEVVAKRIDTESLGV